MKHQFPLVVVLLTVTVVLAPSRVLGATGPGAGEGGRALGAHPASNAASASHGEGGDPLLLGASISEDRRDGVGDDGASDSTFAGAACGPMSFHGTLAIPDDGSWVEACLSDPFAPPKGTVNDLSVRYMLDHPELRQLEVRLTRSATSKIQPLWNRGTAAQGTSRGEARQIQTFQGLPAQAQWRLQIRDLVPGKTGYLKAATLAVHYQPTGPLPARLAGAEGTLSSVYALPVAAGPTRENNPQKTARPTPTPAPRAGKLGPSIGADAQALTATSGAGNIDIEGFEGLFPNCYGFAGACWTQEDQNPDDGKEYLWDDEDFMAHGGSWSAWPAAGGADGLDPESHNYPPNLNSWLKYGPFSLQNSADAEISYWMSYDIEPAYDRLCFRVSTDNANWSGDCVDGRSADANNDGIPDWVKFTKSLKSYVGNSQVWIAFAFYSDDWPDTNDLYRGPFIDDIEIKDYAAGQVTVKGSFWYNDRSGAPQWARFMKVYLMDADPGAADDQLAATATDANGNFAFPTIANWDADGTDTDIDSRGRLDLYLRWETDYNDSAASRHRVTNLTDATYQIFSDTRDNVGDGEIRFDDYQAPPGTYLEFATQIFEDLRKAWERVSPSADPGSVTARWEDRQNCYLWQQQICNSFFWPGDGPNGIFISDGQKGSSDIVVHETGHQYMYNARGAFWYSASTWNDFWNCAIVGHKILESPNTELCAWTEGWADFLPLWVNDDPCFDYGTGPCTGNPDQAYFNLETHGRNDNPQQWPWGHNVEGRVAGALYDLVDNANESPWYDTGFFNFNPIWTVVRTAPHESRFSEFWNSWKTSGNNKHTAVQSIYQNTIDYDSPPSIINLPDRVVLQSLRWDHAIDLWTYSSDGESTLNELGWQIQAGLNPACGVSIEGNRYVNLAPQSGWVGICMVTINVSDGIKVSADTFRVDVLLVASRNRLPFVAK